MTRGVKCAVWVLGGVLSFGCGRTDTTESVRDTDADVREQDERDSPSGRAVVVTATGCLTASGDRFVLTELQPGGAAGTEAPVPTTETYQLTDADDELRQYVGREVRVVGEAEPARVAEVRENTPSPVGTSDRPDQPAPQPQVQTGTQTRIEMRTLSVDSVTATGEDCPR